MTLELCDPVRPVVGPRSLVLDLICEVLNLSRQLRDLRCLSLLGSLELVHLTGVALLIRLAALLEFMDSIAFSLRLSNRQVEL